MGQLCYAGELGFPSLAHQVSARCGQGSGLCFSGICCGTATQKDTEKDGRDWWFLPRSLSNLAGWRAWELIPQYRGPRGPNPAKAREHLAPMVTPSEPRAQGHSGVNELIFTGMDANSSYGHQLNPMACH